MNNYIYAYVAIIIGILLIIFLIPFSMPDDYHVYMSLWNKVELRRYEIVTDGAQLMYGTFAKDPNDDAVFILFSDQEELEKFIDDPVESRDTDKIAGKMIGNLLHETDHSFGIYAYGIFRGQAEKIHLTVKKSADNKLSAKMFIGRRPSDYFILSPILRM